ncbi:MAG TPA: YARHG domain-containing protein [Candidatus Aminicenantes bacterium]|nr:YARHG domain-containing protein [Candidatus Aminicenantes bacterium]
MRTKKSLAVLLAVFLATPLAAAWFVQRDTIGEGIPTWMATARSQDGKLLFWVEYPSDQSCVPVVTLKSDGWEAFAFDPAKIENVAAVIRFTRERLLQAPGYAANGFIFEWVLEKGQIAEMLAGFAAERELLVSLPGREGEVAGTFGLQGAMEAIQGACAACEELVLAENDFVIADSSERLLTKAEVARLSANLLRIARNEIFARHGRVFRDPVLGRHFRSKEWYRPGAGETELSATEKANVALIAACGN